MNLKKSFIGILALLLALGGLSLVACQPPKAEPVKTYTIADGDVDPANWGKAYPNEYDLWLKTKDPKPAGFSKYKAGFDEKNQHYDKLSEYPYMPLLFNGWGFGLEYNEPRGHYYMLIDQLIVDPGRVKAGGACLTCKSPFVPKLKEEMGYHFFADPYLEVHAKIPKEFQQLGVACIDCHDNKDMSLKLSRWTLQTGLKAMGQDPAQFTRQEMRSAVCAQCHVTYMVTKDDNMKSNGVVFPWAGSQPGNISIENIIKTIKSDPHNGEWVQSVTGFKLGFIRHPEYEFFTNNSVHAKAGVSCADCHMPYTRVGANKVSDHNVTSPLKAGMKACQQCHPQTPEWLASQVIAIQDRTVSVMNRAGYAVAVAAKTFEAAHKAQKEGKTIDQALYDQAKDFYLDAFYRVVFIGAENSIGFHNPSEAGRICADALAFASKSESLLRQALTKAGVEVPVNLNLEMAKYLNQRGVKKLMFRPELEMKDPFGIQNMITPAASLGK